MAARAPGEGAPNFQGRGLSSLSQPWRRCRQWPHGFRTSLPPSAAARSPDPARHGEMKSRCGPQGPSAARGGEAVVWLLVSLMCPAAGAVVHVRAATSAPSGALVAASARGCQRLPRTPADLGRPRCPPSESIKETGGAIAFRNAGHALSDKASDTRSNVPCPPVLRKAPQARSAPCFRRR